jgi:hypothetical protein
VIHHCCIDGWGLATRQQHSIQATPAEPAEMDFARQQARQVAGECSGRKLGVS